MRGHLQQGRRQLVIGWLLAAVATGVYLLTMSRTVDWWDCGEYLATSYLLQVGHPPGAPFYQLLARCMMMLSFGHPMWVAPLGNALSALCGGLTVMLLYLTICELTPHSPPSSFRSLAPTIGALCYLFCDTAWFSAVESEVYAMAMLFCSLTLWIMLRWRRNGNPRLLLLVALLSGLGLCVHLMTLLVLPALLWVFFRNAKLSPTHTSLVAGVVLFFLLGLTPYAIVPLRSAADPPINQMGDSLASYLKRENYAHAPLYPRLWRERDSAGWRQWGVGDPASLWDNTKYYASYQLSYMYLRYLMYNFIGRENLKSGRIVLFILPFILGIWGMVFHWRRRRDDFMLVLLLFLFGGIILNFYLNHPCYEPRERDYAYVLSFYAFAIWIGVGISSLQRRWQWVALLAPTLLAVGNWGDHDRSRSHAVHDIAMNHLQSCDHGAILITYGDNDTFPLWYLQQIERQRTDITILNVNLVGFTAIRTLLDDNHDERPVYLTQYAHDAVGNYFSHHRRCEGFCWRLLKSAEGIDDPRPLQCHISDSIRWHITPTEYLDPVSRQFLSIWDKNTATFSQSAK